MTDAEGVQRAVIDDVLGGHVFMSYADFGQRFFETAVTLRRIETATANLAGRVIDVGPLSVGPIGLVKVRANGTVGTPTVERRPGEEVAFTVTIPATLQMQIDLGIDKNRFAASVLIQVGVTARAAEPLQIVIDIEAPTKNDVRVEVKADGMRASVLQSVAGVNSELRRTVAKFVRREIERPEVQRMRVIDVARALDAIRLPD